MALRNILKAGDPTLRKKAREVTVFDSRLHQLLNDMRDTMYSANGAGLAGPQVGVLRRVVVIDAGEGLVEMINPRIASVSAEQEELAEGCLSFPGKAGLVKRPVRVKAEAQDRYGNLFEIEGEGLMARALCHETDHLDGRLFIDLAVRMLDPEELESGEE